MQTLLAMNYQGNIQTNFKAAFYKTNRCGEFLICSAIAFLDIMLPRKLQHYISAHRKHYSTTSVLTGNTTALHQCSQRTI